MDNDIVFGKVESIERCLKRINEEYTKHQADFDDNYLVQDSVILNLQRACEQTIDLAMHVVRVKKLGVPKQSRDAFDLMVEHGIIKKPLAEKLGGMVGFRNISIHEYQKVSLGVVKSIIASNLGMFTEFTQIMIKSLKD